MEGSGDGLVCGIEVPLGRAERVGDEGAAAMVGFDSHGTGEVDREAEVRPPPG